MRARSQSIFARGAGRRVASILLGAALGFWGGMLWAPEMGCAALPDYLPPKEVKVMGVFFVSQGETPPTQEQLDGLVLRLQNTQKFYLEHLQGRDTFALVPGPPAVYYAKEKYGYYAAHPGADAKELLEHFHCTRYNCPYIFFTVFMTKIPPNSKDFYPQQPCGQPFNGGINTGGGMVFVGSTYYKIFAKDSATMHHELGHSFGLVHPSAYGYDDKTNPSIMSPKNPYNPHSTRFIPEDVRSLALNKRVFHKLRFDPATDVPPGYKVAGVRALDPLPGLTGVTVTTNSGETHGSKARNAVAHDILPSKPGGMFNSGHMWHSGVTNSGWVSLHLTFPMEVTLSGLGVHSQCCGTYHAAKGVRVVPVVNGKPHQVLQAGLASIDQRVTFPPTTAQVWQIDFQAGSGKMVIIRGLQFYSGNEEVFLPRFVHPK